MRRLLDQLRFKKNRYARPNQDWICGHADEGHECPLGPDERGRCRHTGECFPAKSGDRWLCTRGEAQGGACAEGPLPDGKCAHPISPCQPRPSLRRTRGRLTWFLVALTLGVLLVVLAGKGRRKWISPGELSVHHATSGTGCEDCHTPEKFNSASFAKLAVFQKRATQDSQLCLNCHSLGAAPLVAHGVPSSAMAAHTARAKAEKSNAPLFLRAASAVTSASGRKSGELACSTCHQEHHGKDFNIAHLSQTQCQVCHSVQFTSLAKGHPEFASYPYQRRTRIYFDHASHIRDHFPATKEKAPTSCQACHIPAVTGGKMMVKSFEQSCAACHAENINKSSPVDFFRVPGIDVASLAKAGLSIGQWPNDADDELTPFMAFLIGSEKSGSNILEVLKDQDLRDLRSATPEQLAAASKLAWAVKEFLYDFEDKGQPFLIKLLQDRLPPGQTAVVLNDLTGGIPRRAGLVSWSKKFIFPDLRREVSDYRRGVLPPVQPAARSSTRAPVHALPDKKKQLAKSGATTSPGDDILGPAESAGTAPTPARTSAATTSGDDILGPEDLASLGLSPAKATATSSPSGGTAGLAKSAVTAPTPAKSGATSAPGDDILGPEDLAGLALTSPQSTAAHPPKPEGEVATGQPWTVAGWFRAKDGFTLSYRPSGHADPFLVAWLNAATVEPSSGSGILRNLATPTGAGACAKCHTVDQTPNASPRVNWTAARPEPNAHSFTKFSHTAHLSLMTERGCQTCHVLNPASTYGTYFQPADPTNPSENRDPLHSFQSNFAALPKMECAKCHTPRIAGDNCLLCHNYHTGAFATDMSKAARIHPIAAAPEAK